jgi:hypothetical protein
MRTIVISLLGTTLVGLAACGKAPAAPVDPGAPSAKTFDAAAQALLAELNASPAKAAPPRTTDPVYQRFAEETGKVSSALGTPVMPITNIDSMLAICGTASKVLNGYVQFTAPGAPPPTDGGRKNIETYFEEIYPILTFSAHCSAVHMPTVESFAQGLSATDMNETRKGGIRQVRSGAFSTVSGLLLTASDPTLGAPRTTEIMTLLAQDIDEFIIALTPEQRTQLLDQVSKLPATATTGREPQVKQITDTLKSTQCGKVCSI